MDELHCSTIVLMNHMETVFQDLPFYCTKKVPKKPQYFFLTFFHRGGTHILVLAQALIYIKKLCPLLKKTYCLYSLKMFHQCLSVAAEAPLRTRNGCMQFIPNRKIITVKRMSKHAKVFVVSCCGFYLCVKRFKSSTGKRIVRY